MKKKAVLSKVDRIRRAMAQTPAQKRDRVSKTIAYSTDAPSVQ